MFFLAPVFQVFQFYPVLNYPVQNTSKNFKWSPCPYNFIVLHRNKLELASLDSHVIFFKSKNSGAKGCRYMKLYCMKL